MRAIWLLVSASLAVGCSTSGPGGTSSGGATTASVSASGGASSGGSASSGASTSSGGGTAGSTGGNTTSGGTGATNGGTTTGGTTSGNICGIVLDAGMIGICNKSFLGNVDVNIGDSIQVINGDGYPHTVTSTDVPGDFDRNHLKKAVGGWTFDTGLVGTYQSDAGKILILVPVDAGITHGAIQPFFCKQHQGMMVGNPNPIITVH
jgi:hypothetical protein